jgi:gliding motility-associated-like protein
LVYFSIFNRWGQQIFYTNELNKGWDGTFKGEPQPAGTYVFQAEGIDYLGNRVYKKGTAVLIR